MILRELLAALATDDGISGSALARRFGVTRAAVWKRIAQLRTWGVRVDARAGVGYSLAAPIDLLEPEVIRAAMDARSRKLLSALNVELDLDSTNSAMNRAVGTPSGSVLFAERQRQGRGRRGRAWQSPFGANLYLSVLWRFDCGLAALGGLSLAVGVALAQAVQALGVTGVRLKWPNDLVHDGRKLGGILIDAGGEWSGACHAVIGIGINVRVPDAAAQHIDQPWTDLAHLLDPLPPRSHLAGVLLAHVLPALQRFGQEGMTPFLDAWSELDALTGRTIVVHENGNSWTAVAEGIDDAGLLRARDAQGMMHRLAAAEISVRVESPA